MGRKWTEESLREAWPSFFVECDGCHEWSRARNADGYGYISWGMRDWRAHRLAYELFVGPIPEGLVVRHYVCDNPCCVNPAHLKLGTPQENNQDKMDKDRWGGGRKHRLPGPLWPRFLRRLNELGISQRRLAVKFGVSANTILETIYRGREKPAKRRRLDDSDLPLLRACRSNGMTYEAIARKFGSTRKTVSRLLRKDSQVS